MIIDKPKKYQVGGPRFFGLENHFFIHFHLKDSHIEVYRRCVFDEAMCPVCFQMYFFRIFRLEGNTSFFLMSHSY
jgi:hypothetical protein